MRTTPKVALSVTALYRLLQDQGLGEPHTLFAGGERYYSPRFRQETDAQLRRELEDAGVATPHGLDEEFAETLGAVQLAGVEYFGWLQDGEGPYSVLVARRGRVAALAQRVGETVTFERVDPDRLVESLIFRFPDVPGGRGDSVSVLESVYGQSGTRDAGGFSMSQPRSARPAEARRLDTLMRAPRTGGGKLYAAKRDHRGKRTRSAGFLTFLDVEQQGRWVVYTTGGRDRERSINAAPGTPQLIAAKLGELLQSVPA